MRVTKVLRIYYCEHCDYHMELRDEVTKEVLVSGDYTHDHIDDLIQGFIMGLKFANYHIIMLDRDDDFVCENCVLELVNENEEDDEDDR